MAITLETLHREFDTYINVVTDILNDRAYSRRGKLLYNVDFAMLFPYLWGSSPPSIPPFKPYGRRIFETLVESSRLSPGFELVFTGPSFYELLDSIIHQASRLERLAYQAQSQYEGIREKASVTDWKATLIKSGMAADELVVLSKDGYNASVKAPIERAMNLIRAQAILKGLGDFIPEKKEIRSLYSDALNDVFERMYHDRSPSDSRSPEDRKFHYGVDSANIVASAAVNANKADVKLLFATEPAIKSRYCPKDGRNPLVPVYWISAMLLKRDKYINSEDQFFESMLQKAKDIKGMLNHITDIKAVTGFAQREITDFFTKYAIPLKDPKHGSYHQDTPDQDKEVFQEMLTDQKKFEKRFVEAKEELLSGAKQLAELEPGLLEDGLIEVMNVANDEVVNRIRRKLKLR
jgi:hypothetical protein